MFHPIPCCIMAQTYCVESRRTRALSKEYVSLVRSPKATLRSTLKQWESVLTQLFMSGSLLSVLWLKSPSLKMYYSKAASWKNVARLALTKTTPLESNKAPKTLYEEHDVCIVDVFSYQNYLVFSIYFIKVGVEIA